MGEGAGRWKRLGEGSEPLSSSVALLIKQGCPGHILPSPKKGFGSASIWVIDMFLHVLAWLINLSDNQHIN